MSKKKERKTVTPPQLPPLLINSSGSGSAGSKKDAGAELYYIPSAKNRQYDTSSSPRRAAAPKDTNTGYQLKMNKFFYPHSPQTPTYVTPRQNSIGFFENVQQDEDNPRIMDEFDNWNNIENWNNVDNLRTLFSWITISALNIECLDEAIKRYRKFIAYGTILGLLFSTASGTISATRVSTPHTTDHVNIVLSALFTILTFSIAIYTGILKTLQIQERLENFIKIKQEWILFSASISSELQLPIHLRKPVLGIISIYKNKFLDLLKVDSEVPEFIKNDIIEKIKKKEDEKYKNEKWEDLKYSEASSLSDVIIEIGSRELKRLVLELDNSMQNAIFNREVRQSNAASSIGAGGGDLYSDDGNASNILYTYRTMESVENKNAKSERDEINKIKRDIETIYKQFSIINGGGAAASAAATMSSPTLTRRPSDTILNTINVTRRPSDIIIAPKKKGAAAAIDDDSVAGLCKKILDRKFSSASICTAAEPSRIIHFPSDLIIAPRTDNDSYKVGSSAAASENEQSNHADHVLDELEKGSPPTSSTITPQIQSYNNFDYLQIAAAAADAVAAEISDLSNSETRTI